MTKFKHDINSVIEACSETLKKEMEFNPKQVLRYFHLFPLGGFEDLLEVPSEEYENWYYLRDTNSHMGLLFNYETRDFILLDKEEKWVGGINIEIFRKTEKDLEYEEQNYRDKMENIRKSYTYKKAKPVIKWYFSCPLKFVGIDTPVEYINNLLIKFPQYFKIENKNIEELTNSLFEAYHYGERNKEENI